MKDIKIEPLIIDDNKKTTVKKKISNPKPIKQPSTNKSNNTNKVKKPKKKINKVNLWAIIISSIACIGLICVLVGVVMIVGMLKDKPELNISDFVNTESSEVYDEDGNLIAELGTTIRENVSYDDLPQVLVDAFVATEDSRFFEHNGFDVPRFTRAFLANIKTLSFSQGGSTFTMQLVKNTYFSNDETGTTASRSGLSGIERKVQEIALAMELEKSDQINKKTILELYLNKLNFGGNRNIRGIQKASEYYFGKSVSDLNLAESAMLAGVINAPNAYNPFNNLDLATERRDEVLYLMKYHGYITEDEYTLAKSIKVEDLLVDYTESNGSGNSSPYQAYIDQVINEAYDLTGKDPYTTGMKIYTYMNKEIQSTMDSIQEENYEGIEFPDDEYELASIAINNQTGAIVGILGGRNYADGGSLLLNHATDQYKQPGSSIKPILDYTLAFENLGWATSHVLVDKPITYAGTSIVVANSEATYFGQVTLSEALGNSLNTTAIQTLQAVIDAKGEEYCVNYLNSIGIDITLEDFDIQCGIGGNKITVSCLQMAGAYAMLLNGGQYTTPHTISRIEFMDGKTPVTPTYTSTQVVSEEAAYLMDTLLYSNVYGGYANLMPILRDDYAVYAKTGTTDWGDSGTAYGIPNGAIKDGWLVAGSSKYTVATWVGYEKAQKDKPSYITYNYYVQNTQGKVTNAILDLTVEEYGTPGAVSRPSGVTSITHILGTYPYAAPLAGMSEDEDLSKYVTTGYIKSSAASLVNPEDATVESMSTDPEVSYSGNQLSISWPTYPDSDALTVAPDTMDISLYRSDGSTIISATGKRLFDYSWVYGPIRYKVEIKVNGTTVATESSETNSATYEVSASAGDKITACAYYGYEKQNISSSQRCKDVTVADSPVDITISESSTTSDAIKKDLMNSGVPEGNISIPTPTTGDTASITVSYNGATFSPGQKITTIKQSELKNAYFTINEVVLGNLSIVPTSDSNGNYTITANNARGDVTWTYNGKTATGKSITVTAEEIAEAGGSITVNASDGTNNASTTVPTN